MSLTANDILGDVSLHLVEVVVDTTLTGGGPWMPLPFTLFPGMNSQADPWMPLSLLSFGIPIQPGVNTISPGSMVGIYPGAMLVVGTGVTQEVITVTSIAASSFTATFQFPHFATEPLMGATFPAGQVTNALFTQSEMLGYLSNVQNDFLLKVRPVVNITTQSFSNGLRYYEQPSDCIRLERVAIGGVDLYDTTQSDIDMNASYTTEFASIPTSWFQDDTPSSTQYGYREIPTTSGTAELWYMQRGPQSLSLTSTLLVPDIMCHYLKYGVLALAFTKDGEQRDPERAEYMQKRFDLGVAISIRFMESIAMAGMSNDPIRTPSSFSPMKVQAGVSGGG